MKRFKAGAVALAAMLAIALSGMASFPWGGLPPH
jgi:hypothetical protein